MKVNTANVQILFDLYCTVYGMITVLYKVMLTFLYMHLTIYGRPDIANEYTVYNKTNTVI